MIFLISIGITLIVTQSSLFHKYRELFKNNNFLYDLFSCPMCFGFWAGIFVFVFSPEDINQYKLDEYNFFLNYKLSYFLYCIYIGSISSFINWTSHLFLLFLINVTDYIKASNVVNEYKKIQEELDEEDNLLSWEEFDEK